MQNNKVQSQYKNKFIFTHNFYENYADKDIQDIYVELHTMKTTFNQLSFHHSILSEVD